MPEATFRLDDAFVEKYKNVAPPFGFNGVGEFIFRRTYSRVKPDGINEEWFETVRRVVEGCYRMQERHIKSQELGWHNSRAQDSAQEMYARMFDMKFLPPGRGLWAMGSILTEGARPQQTALFNCAFVSTKDIAKESLKPFCFLMDMSMLGVGVGFDVKGAGKIHIQNPVNGSPSTRIPSNLYPDLKITEQTVDYQNNPVSLNYGINPAGYTFVIPDTREGWVISVAYLLSGFLTGSSLPVMDYSQIRPEGLLIKGFGGLSSGPEPLKHLHAELVRLLSKDIGKPISCENIVDIQNLIGCCVVAGNVRRSAEWVGGDYKDESYLSLKDYRWNAETQQYEGSKWERATHGWASNNSIYADLGMDYTRCAEQTARNGEPGYEWLENARAYSRMGTPPDWKDKDVTGTNPCVEVSLNSFELCNLVETFPNHHHNLDDFKRTLKFAYLYAKTVTLAKTQWRETNRMMLKNRRIGCSLSGVQQFVEKHGIEVLRQWCEAGYATLQGYDQVYSDWMCIPRSIKLTSIKPSGTVSLVAGATPGMHWPESLYYIRRICVAKGSALLAPLRAAGYPVEDSVTDPSTAIVSFPVSVGEGIRPLREVSMWEQLSMAAFLQRHWSDQQVSSTITFDPATEGHQIRFALDYFQYQLKGISFLPRLEHGAYAQMPYEEISESRYLEMMEQLNTADFSSAIEEVTNPERFCDSDKCTIV